MIIVSAVSRTKRPTDTFLFETIGENGLNSGLLQCSQQKSYLRLLAIILYFSNIIYSNIISLFLLTLKKCILPLFVMMINCLAVILSLKVSNKKQAENIEKSRINTGFFPMFSNKKLSLGSNGKKRLALSFMIKSTFCFGKYASIEARTVFAAPMKNCNRIVGATIGRPQIGQHRFPLQNRYERIMRLGEHVGSPLRRQGKLAQNL